MPRRQRSAKSRHSKWNSAIVRTKNVNKLAIASRRWGTLTYLKLRPLRPKSRTKAQRCSKLRITLSLARSEKVKSKGAQAISLKSLLRTFSQAISRRALSKWQKTIKTASGHGTTFTRTHRKNRTSPVQAQEPETKTRRPYPTQRMKGSAGRLATSKIDHFFIKCK